MKRPVFALLAVIALAMAAYRGYVAWTDPSSRILSASIGVIAVLLAGYFGYRSIAAR